jgi:hypothetical protein
MVDQKPIAGLPPQRRFRWLRWTVSAVLLTVALGVGEQILEYYQARRALDQAMASLDSTDPGWRLEEIEASREEIPEDENSARVVVTSYALLPRSWPPAGLMETLQADEPPTLLSAAQTERLARELGAVQPALDQATRLAELPRGRHHIEYKDNPISTIIEDQQHTRTMAALLRCDALRHAQAGAPGPALLSCRGILNAGRSIGDEPFGISQLIRVAVVTTACQTTEQVLARTEPTSPDLERLQRALEEEEKHPDLRILFRGERATFHRIFEFVERDAPSLGQLVNGSGGWQGVLFWPITRNRLRREHVQMLELMTRQVERFQTPPHEHLALEQALAAEVRTLPQRAAITRMMLPALEKCSESFRRKRAYLRCLTALLACERFRTAHGHWPGRLDDLVPDFLPAVPLDPYDGAPLRFRTFPQGVVAYSVGSDLVDDSGRVDCANPKEPGCDVGSRLWDVRHRRQPPAAREDQRP